MTRIAVLSNIPNTHNRGLFDALRRQGVDLEVVYSRDPSREGRSWTVDLPSGEQIAGGLTGELRGLAAVRRSHPHHVVLSGSYADPTGALRRVGTSFGPGRTWMWGERLRAHPGLVAAYRRAWFSRFGLDGVLAVGTAAQSTYREVVGRGVPVHVFPYVTDVGASTVRERAPRPLVGFAGRLLFYKGLDIAIHALALISSEDRPRFEVAGDGPERAALERLAERLEVDVDWVGQLTPVEVAERRARWWVQVVPTRSSEGWGMVVNEALNGGVPLVASGHVGAAVDLVRDGLTGTVIEAPASDRPAVWRDAIAAYIGDAGRVDREGQAGREVASRFSCDPAAEWLTALLEEAPSSPRSFVADTWQGVTTT